MAILERLNNPQWWIDKALSDLYFLCRCVLATLEDPTPGYKDLYKPTHEHICRFIEKYSLPGHKVIILCPRGWVKSYVITIGWLIQRLLKNLLTNKREHWIIDNATLSNSMQFLKKIKFNLQYNELLVGLFRDVLPKNPESDAARWTLEELEINGNSIEVGSVEGNLVSRHYKGMIHDDLVDKENSRTVDQIIKVIDWWKLAQSLLESDGLEIIIGTRWTYSDLYGHLLEKFLRVPKEIEDASRKQPIFEWHRDRYHYLRYLCWQDPVHETGSTFPTLFPESRLKQLKEEQGEYFPGQYLNDPMSFEDAKFQRQWFVTWEERNIPATRVTIQLVDPMGKDTKQSDYMGHVVIDAGTDKKLYVRYAQRDKKTDADAVKWIVEIAMIYQPMMIGVEEFRYGTFKDLADYIIPQMIRQGKIPPHLAEYCLRIPYRMVELKHHNRPKKLRIQNLTGWVQQGNFLFAPHGMDDFFEELLRWDKWERDDIVDAAAYVLDIVVFPTEKDPPKTFILSDELKMTPEQRERKFWTNLKDHIEYPLASSEFDDLY